MVKLFKKHYGLILIILLAAFFYFFRLQQTFVMAGDSSRDLIDMMNIWQNKIITVVGEPVNTISNNPIQVLFPSLYLYIGIVGLLITNFNPAGSVLVTILVTLVSIPLFYLLSEQILKKKTLTLLATFIYALSPITVSLTRSLWEPNIVIPFSVIAWFFFLYKTSPRKYFIAGFFTGIVFNIHYMNVFPIAVYMFLILFRKDKKPFFYSLLGFLLTLIPLAAFEIKNNFYLIKALMGTFTGFSTFSERTPNPFISIDVLLYIFGLGPYQYFIPSLFNIPFNYRIILNTVLGIAFIYFLSRKQKSFKYDLILVLVSSLLFAWYFEKGRSIGLRYILSAYPLFIVASISFVSSIFKYLPLVLVIPMLTLSFRIITHKLNPYSTEDYLPLPNIEEISNAIVLDNPTGSYNVTENILGDARSLALRFYLLRDAKVKPQPVERYDRIDTLYVISPSLERTYAESRWEFNSSGPKDVIWEKDFGDVKLYKFVTQQK